MHLVVGSTGLVGNEICQRLASEGKKVRALVRTTSDPEKILPLREQGIEVALGDLKNPASLLDACQGVSTVISTASATLTRQDGDSIQSVDLEGHISLIDAAVRAGVEQFIYVSFRTGENPMLQYPLKHAKKTVEHHLMESGMRYTILQASYFMEIWLSPVLGFDFQDSKAQIYGNGNKPISWISYLDVARFVVACTEHPSAQNAIIELGGPDAISPLQAVSIFEDIKDTDFQVNHVPEEALLNQKKAAQDAVQETYAGLMLQYADGDAIQMTNTLNAFSMRFTSVEDYARRVTQHVG